MELFVYYISHPVQHFLNFLEFLKSIFIFIITPIAYIAGFVVLCIALWICINMVVGLGLIVVLAIGTLFGIDNPIGKLKDDWRSNNGGLIIDNLRIERIHIWLAALSTILLLGYNPLAGFSFLAFCFFVLNFIEKFEKLINFFKKKKKRVNRS